MREAIKPWQTRSLRIAALFFALTLATCSDPTDVCTPQRASFGFFSKGDCVMARASFFQGHEWITFFGNTELPEADRFPSDELQSLAEGNRRVDWPKELLVHLNASVVAYVTAVTEYTERPEVQRQHFLLDDVNDSAEAAAQAQQTLYDVTREALGIWNQNRERALALLGRGCHLVQDSFSSAHTVREPELAAGVGWSGLDDAGKSATLRCVRHVKAYVKRAPGRDTYADGTPLLFHGGRSQEEVERGLDDDGIGHTSTEDSIYREGRDCHSPQGAGEVHGCLRVEALRAILATRDYLAAVRRILRAAVTKAALDDLVNNELALFNAAHLSVCAP